MVARLISADASAVLAMSAAELKQSIKASEGRVVLSENVVIYPPAVPGVTNSELARAFGADLILLNMLDVLHPQVAGLGDAGRAIRGAAEEAGEAGEAEAAKKADEAGAAGEIDEAGAACAAGGAAHLAGHNPIAQLHKLVGCPIGVNLEPVDPTATMLEDRADMPAGRQASAATMRRLEELGADFVCFTGNPGTGVTNEAIVAAVRTAKEHFSGLIFAGKMHGAGVDEPVVDEETIHALVDAGVDVLLVPAVGTVPGFDDQQLRQAVLAAHARGALVMTAIGTSQEGAQPEIIAQLAIRAKICGVDIQHLGDAGYSGVAPGENIMALSEAIRGKRHTLSRMARSVNR